MGEGLAVVATVQPTASSYITLPTFGMPTMPVFKAMLTTEVLQQQTAFSTIL